MALKLLQPGTQPIGQFDGLDSQVLLLKGGEVVTLGFVTAPGTDKAAADAADGYTNTTTTTSGQKRPVVKLAADGYVRPLMLADEGISGYGTLFGSVVGGTVGQVVTGGVVLGPSTATGSGKVTCWDKPGLYAVSLDACDGGDGSNPTTSLQPTNQTLDTGAALGYTSAGLLTPAVSARAVTGTSGVAPIVGRFVDFESNGSLVTTPNRLVAALNSPSGLISSVAARQFAFAVFFFSPPAING